MTSCRSENSFYISDLLQERGREKLERPSFLYSLYKASVLSSELEGPESIWSLLTEVFDFNLLPLQFSLQREVRVIF